MKDDLHDHMRDALRYLNPMMLGPPDNRTRLQRWVDRWCLRLFGRQPYGGNPALLPFPKMRSATFPWKREVMPADKPWPPLVEEILVPVGEAPVNPTDDYRNMAPFDDTLRREVARYNELLFAVGNVHPGETRHETALRYIRQAEASGRPRLPGDQCEPGQEKGP